MLSVVLQKSLKRAPVANALVALITRVVSSEVFAIAAIRTVLSTVLETLARRTLCVTALVALIVHVSILKQSCG